MTNEQTREQLLLVLNSNAYINMCTCDDMKNAINALEKQIPKKVVRYSDDESDHVFCPCCNERIGSNEIVYDDFYLRGWSAMYCQECGQAMIWK
jgi:hypothetical protein